MLCNSGKTWMLAFVIGANSLLCAEPRIHGVEVRHPGMSAQDPLPCQLVQSNDDRGIPSQYHMDVDSVICGDGRCEIITVRLFWDLLGRYQRYTLPEGGNLTKKDEAQFTAEDHARLDSILKDRGSRLKSVQKDQIVDPQTAIRDTDAVSGATVLSDGKAVVKGAAYTSYTLWHWANGEVAERIPEITANQCDNRQLIRLVTVDDDAVSAFAIGKLIERSVYDSESLQAVVSKLRYGSSSLIHPIIEYLQSTPEADHFRTFFMAIAECYADTGSEQRIRLLESIMDTHHAPPIGYYDRISSWLPDARSYYEVHLLLTLQEERNPGSPVVTNQAIHLLDHENFLIARRAYWFLEEQNLTPQQQDSVSAFRQKYAARL